MPTHRKRKQNKPFKAIHQKQATMQVGGAQAEAQAKQPAQEETKQEPRAKAAQGTDLNATQAFPQNSFLLPGGIAEQASRLIADQSGSLFALSRDNNTISCMRGDKTVTETTASISNEGGGIGLRGGEEDEVDLSQFASAANQISCQSSLIEEAGQRIWAKEQDLMEAHNLLEKTRLDECNLDLNHFYENLVGDATNSLINQSALQYEETHNGAASHDATYVGDTCGANGGKNGDARSEVKLFTPHVMRQLINHNLMQSQQLAGSTSIDNFAPFSLQESMIENVTKVDDIIESKFDETEDLSEEGAPVLGLNLREYFQKRHLVDQPPVEPLPPIENPLEMTQNHQDWVRGQEDFKINLEQLQGLQNIENGKSSFPSVLVGDPSASEYNMAQQREEALAAFNEGLRSFSKDMERWETMTQADNYKFIEEVSLTRNEEGAPCNAAEKDSVSKPSSDHKTNQSRALRRKQKKLNSVSSSGIQSPQKAQEIIVGSQQHMQQQHSALLQESSISRDPDQDTADNIEQFISQEELRNLLQQEASLISLLQETCISEFMIPSHKGDSFSEDQQSFEEPLAPQIGGSLKNLENYLIRGDLRNCVLCNIKFTEGDPAAGTPPNLPRVLYCGDCICEACIIKLIQRASISSKEQGLRNVAASQLTCPICEVKHIFKMTKTGYVVCNDKYIKVTDDKGPVNYFGNKISAASLTLDKDTLTLDMMMDHSIAIPVSLVLRSLPVNVELLDLLKTQRKVANPSQIEQFSSIHPERGQKSGKQGMARAAGQSPLVEDIDEHMSAFDVKEFVEEYEKEILRRLSAADGGSERRRDTARSESGRAGCGGVGNQSEKIEPGTGWKMMEAAQEWAAVKGAGVAMSQSTDHIVSERSNQEGSVTEATQLNPLASMQLLSSQAPDTPLLLKDTSITTPPTSTYGLKQSLLDMHQGSKQTLSNSIEERNRKKREQQIKRTMQQVSNASKSGGFKSANSQSSFATQSAGSNLGSQALIQRRKKLKNSFMKQRRAYSYSTSSDEEEVKDGIKIPKDLNESLLPNQHRPARPITVNLPELAFAASQEEIKEQGLTTKDKLQGLIPIDLGDDTGLESLFPALNDPNSIEQYFASVPQKCDQMSDGSDMSPKEILSKNTSNRLKKEKLDIPVRAQGIAFEGFTAEQAQIAARFDGPQDNEVWSIAEESKTSHIEKSLEELKLDDVAIKKRIRQGQLERRRQAKEQRKQEKTPTITPIPPSKQDPLLEDPLLEDPLLEDPLASESPIPASPPLKTVPPPSLPSKPAPHNNLAATPPQPQPSTFHALPAKRNVNPIDFPASICQLLAKDSDPKTIPDYAQFVSQLAQQEAQTMLQAQEESASKKKARRNKKKRKRQQQQQQAQQLAELMNGLQIREDDETDVYTLLVPTQVQQWCNDPSSDNEDYKYALAAEDFFVDDSNEARGCQRSRLTLQGPATEEERTNKMSLNCSSCAVDMPLWYKCAENETAIFKVEKGQMLAGKAFQFTKTQLQVVKELVDLGATQLPTHYCEDCSDEAPAGDVAKLCFICAMNHLLTDGDIYQREGEMHTLVMLMPQASFLQQLKRSEAYEASVHLAIANLQRRLRMCQIPNMMRDIFGLVLGCKDAT